MSIQGQAIPERLGRYEIVQRLSAGGMGEVFVARYEGPGGFLKPVALKRIHPHLASDEQFIHMLHDEANVASAVKHPNIVATIDVGHEGENHFVVLEYVGGDSLSRIVREMKKRGIYMPPWIAVWVGAQIASALHAAHEAKTLSGEPLEIIHRDVSLANVMLSDAGDPMLFDFGVAKARQRMVQTSAGELKGKISYMAPETFRGETVNRSVDVFSLGVVIYELLTNKSPFQRGSDLETIAALQSENVPRPSEIRPELDPALDAIVLTAMARERVQRYKTAAELERALRDWARSGSVPHESGPIARWLVDVFPDRILERKQLLGRVARAGPLVALSGADALKQSYGGPGSFGGTPTPLSGAKFAERWPGHASLTPPPASTSSALAQVKPAEQSFSRAGRPPKRKSSSFVVGAAVVGGIGVGAVLAVMPRLGVAVPWAEATPAAAGTGAVSASAVATSPAPSTAASTQTTAPASAEPATAASSPPDAGSASAANKPSPPPTGAPREPGPRARTATPPSPPTAAKGHGPIRRSYE